MDKQHPPESFGAFRPVNHVVIALPSAQALDAAADELGRAGLDEGEMTRYTPQEMMAQADQELAQASPVAAIGQELNLVKAQRELAAQGHSFLVVPAGDDRQVQTIARVAREQHAARAQRYGRVLIEELIEPGDELPQVNESPDSGLDAHTRSGEESGRRDH